ncbi:Oncoprotein-induced transcript 3 protein [Desmophyllum pertusum]|uniref:Oncoprotein-induced transcript 3 protein n=1 Tax=Desmophyllum pertusum TaxID=174260 RepID=A0A9X0CD30_9CNID|nr:Oncoprotein-induced transcript 3 protein [Desmophyllum pertusum]
MRQQTTARLVQVHGEGWPYDANAMVSLNFHCGAYGPGWLDGDHPMPQDGRVMHRVCFHLEGECCKEWTMVVEHRLVYTVVQPVVPNECVDYGVLDSVNRANGFFDPFVSLTDIGLTPGWYRFKDGAGKWLNVLNSIDSN